ncbi:MBOAT-domain-containing protein [Peniophora sp. CONT]|nr:MBOAT-domain-containing protein [Peniophora sp. CONT]
MPSETRPSQSTTPSRKGILRATVDVPAARADSSTRHSPSRWRTPEFYVYYIVFALAVPWMIWVPIRLTSTEHANYHWFAPRLARGWLGRKFDNSDVQYRSFRSNIPALLAFASAFFALKQLYLRFSRPTPYKGNTHLLPFYLTFSLVMLVALHGTSALKVLLILSGNFAIATLGKGAKWVPAVTWVYNMAILFSNERYEGYHYAALHQELGFLDSFSGAYPRWHVTFNITMLRLVSFNMDSYWAHRRTGLPDSGAALNPKQRTSTYHGLESYSFTNYLAYVLYPPLYIAGPIMTFNDWLWQVQRPLSIPWSDTLRYILRFLSTLLLMEFIIHTMYVVAIKDAHAWNGDSPAELAMLGFWNLIVVWLKLLLPWRFFRAWALLDGMDPPENMVRCMANNYSALGFWRAWHRSYNLWIVRYIYIPLGGKLPAYALVFTFVALWHDLSMRLLAWGWLATLVLVPEVTARKMFPATKYGTQPWYRPLCALAGVGNILLLMAANLVGFVLGLDGFAYLSKQIASTWEGWAFMAMACGGLFVGVMVMFEYREEELRQGIDRKC